MSTLQSVQGILKAHFDIAPELLQPEARLAELGIDSLSLIEVMYAVEDRFAVTLPAKSMRMQSKIKTIDDLVQYVDALVAARPSAIAARASTP
jgi:acyl carrier protein